MAYRNKEATEAEAKRLGIDVSGMSWPEMQRAVKTGLELERLSKQQFNPNTGPSVDTDGDKPPINRKLNKPDKLRNDYRNYRFKRKTLAPELRPDANRIIRYDEDLGEGLEVEEKSFMGLEGKGAINYTMNRDYATSTYKVKGRTGRHVIAEASLPKENAGRSFDPTYDWFEVVEFMGRRGYRMSQFKAALDQAGYLQDYLDQLRDEPNAFYLTGILCVSIPVAHKIMREVEERVRWENEHGGRHQSWRR